MKIFKAFNTFSVKVDVENNLVRMDWNGKEESLKDVINLMETDFGIPESILEKIRQLQPVIIKNNKMITKTYSLI
jgi:hypothetical protein